MNYSQALFDIGLYVLEDNNKMTNNGSRAFNDVMKFTNKHVLDNYAV